MREIKFRAWDKYSERMIYKHNCISFDGKVYPHNPDLYLMQYTGLCDKNGKEIYEGDIIKDEFDRSFIVDWLCNEARFSIKEINKKTLYKMVINHLKVEVIGNIYENNELLGVEQ